MLTLDFYLHLGPSMFMGSLKACIDLADLLNLLEIIVWIFFLLPYIPPFSKWNCE